MPRETSSGGQLPTQPKRAGEAGSARRTPHTVAWEHSRGLLTGVLIRAVLCNMKVFHPVLETHTRQNTRPPPDQPNNLKRFIVFVYSVHVCVRTRVEGRAGGN